MFKKLLAFVLCLCVYNALDVNVITDKDIDDIIGDGKGKSWLLLFYVETCPHCGNAKSTFEAISMSEELQGENSVIQDLNIGKIECTNNNWSCMRFNINRVPTIYLLHNDKMFEFKIYPSYDNLLKFLKKEKLIDEALEIPPIFGMMSMISKVFEETVNILNDQIQEIIKTNLNINIKWNSYCTITMLICSLFVMLFIEYSILRFFCRKKVTNKKTVSNTPENTGNTANTSEETKIIDNKEKSE